MAGRRLEEQNDRLGVATFPDHADSAFGLVVNADKALYLAKRMGKNCVRVVD